MVSGQGKLYHARGDDLAVLVVGRALLDAAYRDDRCLGRVDDRREALDPEHAHVRDGNGPALVLLGRQPPLACALGEVLRLARDGGQALARSVPDDRGYEAGVEGDGHRHIHLLVQLDALARVEGVEVRVVPQGHRARLHDEVVDRELQALFFELLVELLAEGHRRVHLDLYGGVEVGDVLLGLRHPLTDDPLHPGRLHQLGPGRLRRLGQVCGLEALLGGLLRLHLLRRLDLGLGLLGLSVHRRRLAALQRLPDVALDDTPLGPRALYPREVQVVLARQAPDYRGGAHLTVGAAAAVAGGSLLARLGLLLGLGSGLSLGLAALVGAFSLFFGFGLAAAVAFRHLLSFTLDKCYRLANRDVLAFFGDELGQGTRVLGLELHADLVGLDLGYRVALGDLFALALEPLEEGALLHRVAHLGHYHLGQLDHLLVEHPLRRVHYRLFAREGGDLQVPRIRTRDFRPAHPYHRGVQVVERLLLDDRGHLAGHPEPPPLLLHRDRPMRLLDRLHDRLLVERP